MGGGDTPHSVYFENCPNVQYGLFGNLEVISRTAASVLTTYLEDCHAVFAPCANQGCDWKFGPWGEDVFVQRCMDHHYVDKAVGWASSKVRTIQGGDGILLTASLGTAVSWHLMM